MASIVRLFSRAPVSRAGGDRLYHAVMRSEAAAVKQYLSELPDERRAIISAVRDTILRHLPRGYEETMSYGMIGYVVPHTLYPSGYHCNPELPLPYAHLASQKNHRALYLMCIYADEGHAAWFRQAWLTAGKRLDMGKSCVRFKKLEDVPLDVVGQAVARVPVEDFVTFYEKQTRRR
ncbi:MAG: DUF1801 domain-containing protein [Planctomycetota bacterium]